MPGVVANGAEIDAAVQDGRSIRFFGAAQVPEDFYFHICEFAADAKVPAILDARGAALKLALRARPMIAKPNRQELGETLGVAVDDETSLRKAMIALHGMGARWWW